MQRTTADRPTTVDRTTAERTPFERPTVERTPFERPTAVDRTTVERTTVERPTTVDRTTAERTTAERPRRVDRTTAERTTPERTTPERSPMSTAQLVTLALLGVFHGVNPGMGWLFAVSIGLQERSRRALLLALPFVALGHEASIGVMIVVLTATSSLVASKVVVLVGGVALLGFGAWQLWSKRHLRWVGMRLTRWELAGWSFVMSSAHGAGLMLLPVFVFPVDEHISSLDVHRGIAHVALSSVLALAVHVAAMIVTCGVVALVVFEVVGLSVLRRVWFNLDRVWAFALVGAGAATLLTA